MLPQMMLLYVVQAWYVVRAEIADCPTLCKCLDKGSIMTCVHSDLQHMPRLLSTTMLLDLDHNRISLLRNNTLAEASRLELLSLQDNVISEVETGVFASVPELRVLRLGHNRLTYLPRDVFQNNHKLQALDLHGNSLVEIPDHLLTHLHSLQQLNLSFNHIPSPQLGPGFKYTTQLQSLDMSGNPFVSLESHVFQATLWWDENSMHHLNLSHCNIRHIHPKALEKLFRLAGLSLAGNPEIPEEDLRTALQDLEVSSLQVINLSSMNLSTISEFFRRVHLQNLVELYLANNSIETISQRSFFYLVSLELLDLSYNAIEEIGDLAGLSKLRNLNLAFNRIHLLHDTIFEGLQNLHHLDLSHNSLLQVTDAPFQNLFELKSLDLSCNQISSLSIESGLESLEELYISFNKISQLGAIKRLLRLHMLDISHNIITRLGENVFMRDHDLHLVNFSGNSIYDIHSKAFAGSTQDILDLSCNRLARLTNFGWRKIVKLHLENNAISNLTANSFKRLTTLAELHLQGNQFNSFPGGLFYDQYDLRVLDLSFNPSLTDFLTTGEAADHFSYVSHLETLRLRSMELRTFPWRAFANLSSLRTLELSFNNIYWLGVDSFTSFPWLHSLNLSHNALQTVNPEIFAKNKILGLLDVSNNPFHCTCELMPFQRWLFRTNVTVPHKHSKPLYHCTNPPEWKFIALTDFHLESTMCSHHEKAVIFTAVSCVLLALTLTLLLIMCRYKWAKEKDHNARYSAIDEASSVQVNNFSARD